MTEIVTGYDEIARMMSLKIKSYHPTVVYLIKHMVPAYQREFDSETQTWRVEPDYFDELCEEIIKRGHTITGPVSCR